jgi:hypothetical protein
MPKKKAVTRKVLTAVMSPNVNDSEGATTYYGTLVVVCDDGAVFGYYWPDGAWSEMPPVPGTAREPSKAKEDSTEQAKVKKKFDADWQAYKKKRNQK